jgi:phage terminase large subunit GpA-like protein
MTSEQTALLRDIALACLAARAEMRPSKWCCENLRFNEANNHGPFRTAGCEYVIEVLDDFANPHITDEALVWGSQTKKTGTFMGGVGWMIENDPTGVLWVMPNYALISKFNRQRLMPMIRASEVLADKIPTGAQRHDFSTGSMMLGASTLNFVGANSASNVKSTPARAVIQDEVDAFEPNRERDTHPCINADERTKDQSNPKRFKSSTPTLVEGLIWQEYLKGDQRRYFVPCPKCKKEVLFAWSRE